MTPMLAARPKLGEECARYLRDALLSGTYRAGQKLVVEDVARQLGVSAMPVREALVMLANEGMVETLPRRGFRVARLKRRDIEDAYMVHSLVAGLLVEAAADVIDGATLGRLFEIQRDIERLARRRIARTERAAQIEQLNFLFHRTINHVPDADRLRWFLRAASRYVPRHFYEAIPGWIEATVADHPAIITALQCRDGAGARRLMEEHIRRAGRLVVARLSETGLWAGDGGGEGGVPLRPPASPRG